MINRRKGLEDISEPRVAKASIRWLDRPHAPLSQDITLAFAIRLHRFLIVQLSPDLLSDTF